MACTVGRPTRATVVVVGPEGQARVSARTTAATTAAAADAHDVAGAVGAALATLLGPQAVEDRGLEAEGELVLVEAVGVGRAEDHRQHHEVLALVATRRAAFGVGAERHAFVDRQLADDLHGDEALEVLAGVGRHRSHPISSSARRRVRSP